MLHAPGTIEAIACTEGKWPEHHFQLVIPVLGGKRTGVVADTLNNDCIFDFADQRANAERLTKCWNCHDELVAALELMLADVESYMANPHGHRPASFVGKARNILAKAK